MSDKDYLGILKEINTPQPNNRISLERFRVDLLPYIQNNDDETMIIPIAQWAKVAGGYYGEVDVIDGQGNVVYVLPALCNRIKTVTDKKRGIGMDEILLEAHRRGQFGDKHKTAILNQAFDKKFDIDPTKQMVEKLMRWNVILEAEGQPLLPIDIDDFTQSDIDIPSTTARDLDIGDFEPL